jgi:hypothetical protein
MYKKDSLEKERRKGRKEQQPTSIEGMRGRKKGRVRVISTGTLFRYTIAGGEAGRGAAATMARVSGGAVSHSRGRSCGATQPVVSSITHAEGCPRPIWASALHTMDETRLAFFNAYEKKNVRK